MSSEVVRYQPEQIREMATAVVKSGLFSGIKTVEQAYTLMMLADADGIHPMKAALRYDILPNGKPSMKGEAMLAEFMARGGTVKWLRLEDEICEAIFYSPGVPDGAKIVWTLEDARRAQLAGKDNWRKFGRQMLKWRVVTDGVKTTLPAAGQGLYPTEVVQDFDDKPKSAEYEVVGAESGNVGALIDNDTTSAAPASTTAKSDYNSGVESATGLSTEEHLAEAKKRREEAAERYTGAGAIRHGGEMRSPDGSAARESRVRDSGSTDAAPIEQDFSSQLQASIDAVKAKHGRKGIPDHCPACGEAILKYEASDGKGEYWECRIRHDDRHKMKEAGTSDAQIRQLLEGHYKPKWVGIAKEAR